MTSSNIGEQALWFVAANQVEQGGWEQFCRQIVKFHSIWNVAEIEEQVSPPNRGCSKERLWGSHPKSSSLDQGVSKKPKVTTPASHDPSRQVSRQFQREEPCPETCKKITGVHLWNEVDVNSFLCVGNLFVFRRTRCIWDILKNPSMSVYSD